MDPYQALLAEIKFVKEDVPACYKTLGQFLKNKMYALFYEFDEACYESASCAMKSEARYKKFQRCAMNIFHAAATVLQKKLKAAYEANHAPIGPARLRQRNHPDCDVMMDIDHTPEFDDKSREELIEEIMRLRASVPVPVNEIVNPEEKKEPVHTQTSKISPPIVTRDKYQDDYELDLQMRLLLGYDGFTPPADLEEFPEDDEDDKEYDAYNDYEREYAEEDYNDAMDNSDRKGWSTRMYEEEIDLSDSSKTY